ncbi:MAG: hypothetical protein CMH56_14770 [Myxococcales bacterium]|nr:hypothetical protein [Myxococcales bacterium]|tara:strand:- start:695 stop:1804 length:1110 start_codon:yes stop_codon:yes gene_type:complete
MAKNFTISNFKRWLTPAGLTAIALVACAEVFWAPYVAPEQVFAFDQNNYDRPGRQDYEAMRVLLTYPQKTPDIAILGSSRPRDGVLVPELKKILAAQTGQSFEIVNYAAVGFRAFDLEVLAKRLTEDPRTTPKMVFLPVNPRFLQERAHRDNLRFTLMRSGQLIDDIRQHGIESPLHITETLLSNAVSHLFALRLSAREWVEGELPNEFSPLTQNPIFGGYVKLQNQDLAWQAKNKPITSIVNAPLKQDRLSAYVAVEWPEGVNHLGAKEKEAFENGLRTFKAAGVKVVLMDLPMSDALKNAIPQVGFPEYHQYLAATAKSMQLDFVPVEGFPTFTDDDFREQSHVNRAGALKLTRFLADWIHENSTNF